MRSGLQSGQFQCIVVAADASPRAQDKVIRLAVGKSIPLVTGPSADAIGQRLGRPPVMVAGVVDRALAQGLADAARGDAQTEA